MPSNMRYDAWRVLNFIRAHVDHWKYGITPAELRVGIIEVVGASELTIKRYTTLMLELGMIKKQEDGYEIVPEVADKYA